jgi:hypothetical protein
LLLVLPPQTLPSPLFGFGVRPELTGAFYPPEERGCVIMPDTDSGYGTLARPLSRSRCAFTSGADKECKLTAWEVQHYNSGVTGLRSIYDIQQQKNEFHRKRSPLLLGSCQRCIGACQRSAGNVVKSENWSLAGSLPLSLLTEFSDLFHRRPQPYWR